jgi:hypothetical protein
MSSGIKSTERYSNCSFLKWKKATIEVQKRAREQVKTWKCTKKWPVQNNCLLLFSYFTCTHIKQWTLNSEFIEFEYSPEICHFWGIQVLAKMAFFGNVLDSPDLPTFTSLVCSDSKTRKSQVLQVLCEFGESGEFGKFSKCRLDCFMYIKYVICA